MRALRSTAVFAVAASLTPALLSGCGGASDAAASGEAVVVGYQSKTINTVTAGTLMRSLGTFQQRLDELGARTHKRYRVVWQDYDTGAPITAQMLAGKIDIGSMGDYPLLINGARAQQAGPSARTVMLSVTGYNAHGALNMVLAAPNSPIRRLTDLRGATVSTSVGSAAHGTLAQALRAAGLNPATDVRVQNQQPPIGASALRAGNVAALAQFVAWPGLLAFQGQARLVYDGAALGVPTLHGVVARQSFVASRPDVVKAFLRAQLDATDYLRQHPIDAANRVAAATGLPPEVVYLYNGAGGMVSFDATVKPALREALAHDVPFLSSIGVLSAINLSAFIDTGPLEQVYGPNYQRDLASLANPAPITGRDAACGGQVGDAATASELWLAGEPGTRPASTPTCLLRLIRQRQQAAGKVRAAYVPDAATGTRWFADQSLWVLDPAAPATARLLPFTTEDGAQAYQARHPGAREVSYSEAVGLA